MGKIFGTKSDFALVRDEGSRVTVGYGYEEVDSNHATWYEVYFPKKKGKPTLQKAKEAIISDIDKRTDEKILNGYEFTPDGASEPIVVWLSRESQTNFSEAQRLEVVPVKFKLNEDENKNAIYHTFETFSELDRFYKGGVAYIQQCLNAGWQEKDSIEWSQYEALLPDDKDTPSVGE